MIESSLRVRDDLVADCASYNMLLTASSTATGSTGRSPGRGYATDGSILQGFGIVTATYQARDVVNLASRAPDQTFVLDADVARPHGVEAFVHLAATAALPGWVGQLPAVRVSFHNSGSYVVQCTVAYDTPDARDLSKRVEVGGGIPGLVHLPLDAANLRVTCRFWHVDDWGPRHVLPAVPHPVREWRQGQGAVDIQGFWPADYDVAWAA